MNRWMKLVLGALVLGLCMGHNAFADENEVVALKNEVKDLKGEIAAMKDQMKVMQGHISGTEGKPQSLQPVIPPGEHVEGGLIHTIQDIHMGGYLDTQFNQNFTKQSANVGGNPLRVFDNDQNTFAVHLAELDFQKNPNPEGGAGFRLDIAMGEDAEAVDGGTFASDADEFSIQQAYAELVAPLHFFDDNEVLGNTVDFKAGRFVTLAGAEVIEAADNWNISRSFMFGFAIPFTHTGARATYKLFKDKVTTFWGVNNGWDNVVDNNIWKTLESGFTFNPIESVTWTSSFYFGPENARQAGHKRFLMSNVALWKATDKLSLMGNFDFGNERRVVGLEGKPFENAQWWGIAGYARYQLTDKFAMAARVETFRDDDGFRTTAGRGVTFWSPTLTAEYKLYDNLISRLEWRYDKENVGAQFNGQKHQNTLDAQLIYLI